MNCCRVSESNLARYLVKLALSNAFGATLVSITLVCNATCRAVISSDDDDTLPKLLLLPALELLPLLCDVSASRTRKIAVIRKTKFTVAHRRRSPAQSEKTLWVFPVCSLLTTCDCVLFVQSNDCDFFDAAGAADVDERQWREAKADARAAARRSGRARPQHVRDA
jgi:hypothetical protein